MEWVEVQAKTVDEAVAMAVSELGVASRDEVTVEILQEPKSGFLGVGRMEALVKVTPKPKEPRKRRRRKRRGRDAESGSGQRQQEGTEPKEGDRGERRGGSRDKQPSRNRQPRSDGRQSSKERKPMKQEKTDKPSASIEEQADVAKEFIGGLIEALGLEGTVETRIEDDVLYIDVSGDQTEALVGTKGSTMFALHELTRTVIQRKTFGAPRMRLDVAGYTERRREALRIYTTKLADRVRNDGEEVMLEPMNAADRKVVHDTIAGIDGVISFSEGEDPNRAVVLGPDPDAAPAPDAVPDETLDNSGDADGAPEGSTDDGSRHEDNGESDDDEAGDDDDE